MTVWGLHVDSGLQLGHVLLWLLLQPSPQYRGGQRAGSGQASLSKNSLTPNSKTYRKPGTQVRRIQVPGVSIPGKGKSISLRNVITKKETQRQKAPKPEK